MEIKEWKKVQITKQGTLNATFTNEDGDLVQFVGANVVHKDLKQAMQSMTPHLALLTEQREAMGKDYPMLKNVRITDDGDNIYKRLNVDAVCFSDNKIAVSGTRLAKSGVIKVTTPLVDTDDNDQYEFVDDLSLDADAVKYEAKEYINNRKWGVVQASIEFESPFEGVEPQPVAEADADAPKKRGRKSKKAA